MSTLRADQRRKKLPSPEHPAPAMLGTALDAHQGALAPAEPEGGGRGPRDGGRLSAVGPGRRQRGPAHGSDPAGPESSF